METNKNSSKRDSNLHRWNLNPQEAIQIQKELRPRVIIEPLEDEAISLVAGVDVGLPRGAKIARAAIAVLDYATMELVDQAVADLPIPFPYVPGLLSFREMPVILAALERLETQPDLFIVDGHGYAHPRRFGLACHLGVWLDRPAIGCGKSILVGEQATPKNPRGSMAPLIDNAETIGMAVRTREAVKPVYISIGHRVDLESAIRIILNCGRNRSCCLRLPEPIRWAHRLASQKV
jgi:deoxyribonuclease V